WDLKGLFQRAVSLAVPGARVQVDATGWIAVRPDGRVAGSARRVMADAPAWAAPVLGFELELDPSPRPPLRYSALPVLPAAVRDLALLVPPAVTAAQIEEVIRGGGGAWLGHRSWPRPGIESGNWRPRTKRSSFGSAPRGSSWSNCDCGSASSRSRLLESRRERRRGRLEAGRRSPGDHRRQRVHRDLRSPAGVHPRGGRLLRRDAAADPHRASHGGRA